MRHVSVQAADISQTLEDDLHPPEVLDRLEYAEAWGGKRFAAVWENIPAPDLFIANALARREWRGWKSGMAARQSSDSV